MLRRLPLLLLLAPLLAAPAAQAATADEIVVLRHGGLTAAERDRADVTAPRALGIAGVQVVRAEEDRAASLATLDADPDVVWAEPNLPRFASADPLQPLLWGLENTGQPVWGETGTPDADIDAPAAWAAARGAGVTVAVVDSGVDLGHPDLAGRLVPGWDFVGGDPDPTDENGHGTHVSGTVAAAEDGAGVVGVAPDAALMPLRVLDASGRGGSAGVAAGFARAGDAGVRVVNASLGSGWSSRAEMRAIRDHPGTLYVVAAGNGGVDRAGDDNDNPSSTHYPCALDLPNVLCVGASTPHDQRAGFSNFGAASVDLFAPGVNVVSTQRRGVPTALDQHFGTGTGFELMHGTSMAAPHAAGVAALVAGLRPDWGAEAIKAAVLAGADRVPGLAGLAVTGGRLNASGAVAVAGGVPAAPTVPAPAAPAPAAPAPASTPPAAAPRISRLRLRGRPVVCRRGCRPRAATLSFLLAGPGRLTARLERRRCARKGRCAYKARSFHSQDAEAGRHEWRVAASVLGMPLARGAWRLTLATSAGKARHRFTVSAR